MTTCTWILIGISSVFAVTGKALSIWAYRAEKASMSEEDYRVYLMYASSLGPAGPCNSQMFWAMICYVMAFLTLVSIAK